MISNEPWHIDPQVFHTLQNNYQKASVYILVDGGAGDYEKVGILYRQSPVKGFYIGKVQVIYNPALTQQFEGKVKVLNARASSSAFKAKWDQEGDLPIRQRIDKALRTITILHSSTSQYVQLYPAFHGTKAPLLDSICRTGFANLATTDNGFFGKGLYNTQYAEYAHRVYSDGTLIFNWVAFYSAYPVTLPDMPKLQGSANYANYDAHYTLVAPKNPQNPAEVVYYPITHQNPTYDELVVFDSSHILPRYLITLTPDAVHLKTLSPQVTGTTLLTAMSSYFSEAPSSLQPLLQKELTALTSQLTTPLNLTQCSLLTLIERSKGEADSTIQSNLANRITKLLENPASPTPSVPSQLATPAITPKAPKEIRTLQGHTGPVSALIQLTDGTLASGSRDQTIKIWNHKTRACIQTLRGHTHYISILIQLTDGTLASYSWDETIKIWNLKTGTCTQTLRVDSAWALIQLADGTLASGYHDRSIKIWNLKTGTCTQTLRGHTEPVTALIQLADGTLASGSADTTIKIWNPKIGACTQTLRGHKNTVEALIQLADGTLASGSLDATIKIWNLKTGTCTQTLRGDPIWALIQLTDGTLASGSDYNTIKIWNPKTGACTQILAYKDDDGLWGLLERRKDIIQALIQLTDGTLASGSTDKTIRIWG